MSNFDRLQGGADPRIDEARHDRNEQQERAMKAEEQRDALLTALRDEVKRLRKIERDCAEAAREFRDPVQADKALIQSDEAEHTANRLQKLLDTYGGD